jgi:hydroxyacyl-ACP dehydratase HTD2-like protein with hotdog domain
VVEKAISEQTYWDDVEVGDELAAADEHIDPVRMFLFSAATHNGHRIHYDRTWASEVEGYPDIVVHGPLQAAILARLLTDFVRPTGRLVSFTTQNRASAYPGEQLHFVGQISGKRVESDEHLLDLELRAEKVDGTLLIAGSATVALPCRKA